MVHPTFYHWCTMAVDVVTSSCCCKTPFWSCVTSTYSRAYIQHDGITSVQSSTTADCGTFKHMLLPTSAIFNSVKALTTGWLICPLQTLLQNSMISFPLKAHECSTSCLLPQTAHQPLLGIPCIPIRSVLLHHLAQLIELATLFTRAPIFVGRSISLCVFSHNTFQPWLPILSW
jgi:hypothetical protein